MSAPLAILSASEPEPVPAPQLALRLSEAADAISVSRATLWRLLRAGEIPVVRFGGIKRILRRDLEAWLEAHKQ